jgi:hypothetical protein
MTVLYTIAITLAALAAAAYAQWRIPFHTATPRHALITRLMLLIVGVAFGVAVATAYNRTSGWLSLLAFLLGFGAVHVPAAAILFLKRQRAKT